MYSLLATKAESAMDGREFVIIISIRQNFRNKQFLNEFNLSII